MTKRTKEEIQLPEVIDDIYSFPYLANVLIGFHNSVPQVARVNPLVDTGYWSLKEMKNHLLESIEGCEEFFQEYRSNSYVKGQAGFILTNRNREFFIIVHLDYNYHEELTSDAISINYIPQVEDYVLNTVMPIIRACPTLIRDTKNRIHLVIATKHGYETTSNLIEPPAIDFELNYNKDFKKTHEVIVNGLNNKRGLVLLHGSPGGGKSFYLKALTGMVSKKVIFLPPNLASSISDPGFITFLCDNKNSVLVIEDAENVIKKRDGGGNQAISNLLNLSDGFLADVLNIGVVATFNCPVSDIDTALMRKGRLIAMYEFGHLSVDRASKLSEKLGFGPVSKPMTLADIYNQEDKGFTQEKQTVGFKF